MFGFGKKNKKFPLVATQTGAVVTLDDVPDEVFSQRILGEGAAVIPTDGKVYSPVDGKVEDVTETKHAVCIVADSGAEILVHMGLDTVSLKGEGFTPAVKAGDRVKAGDLILEADLDFIREKGYKLHTPTVITDMEGITLELEDVKEAVGGQTVVAYYEKA